jgi:hypothetical protein
VTTPEQQRRLGSAMTHRTVHDIELEVRRTISDLQRLERDGDWESYCAACDPELLLRALVEIYPEEMREAYKNVLRDRPQLFVTRH